MSKYPDEIDDNSSLPLTTDNVTAVNAAVVNNLRSAILAIEGELGEDPSREYGSVRDRLDALKATLDALTGAVSSPTGPVGGDLTGSLPNPAVIDLTISGQQQGSILYFNGTNWVQLSPSTSGYVLTTHGTGANPTWDATSTNLTALAPVDVTKSAAVVGVATTAARSDHKHNILTAAPSSIGNANTEGSATSLARSDHIHALAGTVGGDLSGTLPNPQVNKLTISGQQQGSILYYNGSNWVQLAPGSDGYVLTTHSTGQNPSWTAIANIIATNYLTVSDWYVNISTGSDTNDGLTSLTPLKTIEELSNRLCPNGDVAFLKQATTVHVAAGTYGNPYFNIGSGSLTINCTPTLSSDLTLNAVTNTFPSTSTRGEIEAASGTFIDYSRIRVTGGSQIGTLAFSTGLNLSVNKTFTSAFLNSSGSQANLNIGDTVAIETLNVTFDRAVFISTNPNYTIIVNGAILSDCNCSPSTKLNNCNIINAMIVGGAIITFCSISNSTIGYGNYTGYGNQFLGTSTSNFAEFNFSSTNVFDDCNNFFGQDVGFNFANIELINRINSIGLIFNINSKVNVTGYLWSGTGAYSTAAVQMKSGSYFSFTNLPTIAGTANVIIAGVSFNWSQLPQTVGNTTAEFNTTYTSAANDIAYWTGNYWKRLPPASDGYVLTTHSTTSAPTWSGLNTTQLANGYVPNWYVNASTGNDDNDGKSSITAFRTVKKLSQTLSPGGQALFIQQNTDVYLASGSYADDLVLNITGGVYTFRINGTVISGSNITLSSVTNTVAGSVTIGSGTRGQIATASGTFAVGQKLRCVAGSNVGAIAYVQALNGDAQHAYVTHWHTLGAIGGTQVNLTAGDVVVVDTNATTLSFVNFTQGGSTGIRVSNINGTINYSCQTSNVFGVIFDGCTGSFGTSIGGIAFSRCQGNWFNSGGYLQFLRGNHIVGNYLFAYTKIDFSGGDCITGAGLQFYNCQIQMTLDWAASASLTGMQFENLSGTGSAITVGSGTTFSQGFNIPLWGVTGNGAGTGIDVNAGGTFHYTSVPTIQAATPMRGAVKTFSSYTSFSMPGYNAFSVTDTTHPAKLINDGYISLLGSNVSLVSDATDYKNMSNGIFIGENTVNPSANPSNGSFLYVDHFNHHPTIRTQDGYIVDLTTITKFDNSSASSVANWYVNASTGNDDNDGLTALTALRTTEKLNQKLCPGGIALTINQNTNVNIAAGIYNFLDLNIIIPVGSNYTFKVICDYTSSAPITLSGVTNTVGSATPTRGSIQTASGTFVDKARVRSTSGASIGAITYITGLTSSTNAFVKTWFLETAPTSFGVVNIANGTTVVIDTLQVTINRLRIRTTNNPLSGVISVWDAILPSGAEFVNIASGSAGLYLSQCQIGGGSSTSTKLVGNMQTRNSRLIGASTSPFAVSFHGNSSPVLQGCVIECPITFLTAVVIPTGSCFNGGTIVGGDPAGVFPSGSMTIFDAEWVNGSGTAVTLNYGCQMSIFGQQFGFGTSYAVGFSLNSNSCITVSSVTYLGILATQQITMVGHNHTYAQVPIAYPNSRCNFSLATDPLGIPYGFPAQTATDWYVNASTGNDSNDGLTALTALKTTERLAAILCPGGTTLIVRQNTTIHLAAGTYDALELSLSIPVGSNYTFDVHCDFTSGSPITLSGVTNTVGSVSPTRGSIQTASGTFVDKARVRSTSGAASGAITYITGLTSSTNAFVKSWFLESSFTQVNIANGTTVVLDTLQVTINRVQIRTTGHPIGGQIRVWDAILPYGAEMVNQIGGSASIYFAQCKIGGGSPSARISGNIQVRNSQFTGGIITFFGAIVPVLSGCVFESVTQFFSTAQIYQSNCLNGGTLFVSGNTAVTSTSVSIEACEWVNGAGATAITVGPSSTLQIFGQQFGFGATYAIGFALAGGAAVVTNSASYLGIPTSSQQVTMAGQNVNYTDIPRSYPNADCFFSLLNDPTASSFGPNITIDGYYGFTSTATSPQIIQLPNLTSNSVTGKTLTISAQSMSGSNTRGGNLFLSSGTGTSLQGAPDGYIQINRGTQIVANWLTGNNNAGIIDDFIALGRVTALTGNIRLSNNGSIKFRKADNTDDIVGLSIDSSNNLVTTANVSNSASGGAATALPANPQEYLTIVVNGNIRKIPLYLT